MGIFERIASAFGGSSGSRERDRRKSAGGGRAGSRAATEGSSDGGVFASFVFPDAGAVSGRSDHDAGSKGHSTHSHSSNDTASHSSCGSSCGGGGGD